MCCLGGGVGGGVLVTIMGDVLGGGGMLSAPTEAGAVLPDVMVVTLL